MSTTDLSARELINEALTRLRLEKRELQDKVSKWKLAVIRPPKLQPLDILDLPNAIAKGEQKLVKLGRAIDTTAKALDQADKAWRA